MRKFLEQYFSILLSLLILLGAAILCSGLFFYKFNGELSSVHQNWGAFGSYISGTVGVLAACIAVIWLMISVHLQKVELTDLKNNLLLSAKEQKKQTYISALTALISSSRQAISEYQNDLIALNNGNEHLYPLADKISLHEGINQEWRKLNFYQEQIEVYLKEKYSDPDQDNSELDDEPPF